MMKIINCKALTSAVGGGTLLLLLAGAKNPRFSTASNYSVYYEASVVLLR